MPLTFIRQDITKMKVDVIVNAANTQLLSGGGVCGAIFKAAGPVELNEACKALAPIHVGEVVMTPGFNLPAKHIIHTPGPIYQDGKHKEKELLSLCYRNSLNLAISAHCKSISFPLLSSGIYGYPKEEALQVALETITKFLESHELDVFLVIYDKNTLEISTSLLGEIESYIDDHYSGENTEFEERSLNFTMVEYSESTAINPPLQKRSSGLEDLKGNLDESFSKTLLRLIDTKKMSDVEVYKKANLDRKLFSKIRSDNAYTPSKRTAIALAIALELSLNETEDLLKKAGYALSHSSQFDLIVEYFILHKKYDIHEINQILFNYDQPLLGS
jgi:O-acetyl-ADP-ribose deacetylase